MTCALLATLAEEGQVAPSGYWFDGFLGDALETEPKTPSDGCRCRTNLGLGDSAPPPFWWCRGVSCNRKIERSRDRSERERRRRNCRLRSPHPSGRGDDQHEFGIQSQKGIWQESGSPASNPSPYEESCHANGGREFKMLTGVERLPIAFAAAGGAVTTAFSGVFLAGAPPSVKAIAVTDSSPGQ